MKTNSKKILKKKASVFKELYTIKEPYVYAAIVIEPETHRLKYELVEPTLLDKEIIQLNEVKTILIEEIDVNLKERSDTQNGISLHK